MIRALPKAINEKARNRTEVNFCSSCVCLFVLLLLETNRFNLKEDATSTLSVLDSNGSMTMLYAVVFTMATTFQHSTKEQRTLVSLASFSEISEAARTTSMSIKRLRQHMPKLSEWYGSQPGVAFHLQHPEGLRASLQ